MIARYYYTGTPPLRRNVLVSVSPATLLLFPDHKMYRV